MHCRSRVFIVCILSFKMFIYSVYSVTAITMPFSSSTSMPGSVDFLCEDAFMNENDITPGFTDKA